MRQIGVSLQQRALAKRLLIATHIFGVLGVVFSAVLMIKGMTVGGLTLLAIAIIFWGGAVFSTRAGAKRQL